MKIMAMKKHFICTHTWNNDEARQEALKFMEKMTDKDFLDLLNNDKAETVQHWMGKDDFFFCHWYAESEDAIYETLEKTGFATFMITLPCEMPRFVTKYDVKNTLMDNPDST